ncbi:MAG: hypothetical protein ACO1QS_04690 [Verrucomicrobiota bacterium]
MEKNSPEIASAPLKWWRSRCVRWLVRLAYVLAMAGLVGLLLKHPLPQVGVMRVVDEQGKPVAGAVVVMDGLRSKSKSAHWGWFEERHGSRGPYESDANGVLTFYYPAYVMEQFETSEVSFGIKHQEYCSDRILDFVVDSSPPRSAGLQAKLDFLKNSLLARFKGRTATRDIKLKRGAILEVKVELAGKRVDATKLLPVSNNRSLRREAWQGGPDGTLRCAQIPPGKLVFYLAYLPENERACFTETQTNTLVAGQTNTQTLTLRPGVRVSGQLSAAVTNEVKNGQVNAWCNLKEGCFWATWTEVAEAGKFVFDSLPPGTLELAGICDGFVSKIGKHPNVTASSRLTQLFEIRGETASVTLEMEPAAACLITVLKPDGSPLGDATISFWPNVAAGTMSTIFPGNLLRSENNLSRGMRDRRAAYQATRRYNAKSDSEGNALVVNLPEGRQSLAVQHEAYEMMVQTNGNYKSRSMYVQLSAGVTNHVQVIMQKKGTEVLED